MNNVCNWWAGLFYGVVPNSYAISHNKIHHAYSNGLLDVHTNWDLDRTKPFSFLLYIPRFAGYWMSISPIWYFYKGVEKTERRFLRGLIFGVLYHVAAAALVAYLVDLRFMFLYFLLPMPEAIVFLGGVSYIWHAFIDPNDYDNYYVSSMTIVNGRENMWNEDYHVEHHFAAHLHWTEFPEHYSKNEENFRQKRATIFTDTEEGELFFLLITKSWDKMAAKFVDLSNSMSLQEKKELLIQRLSHTVEVSA
uniref:Fatty acid desaturase domain-containing protein n=1 Tax=Arcella intermedia TaxID=1963864 RepID=A0A6B2LFE8_9EUKA